MRLQSWHPGIRSWLTLEAANKSHISNAVPICCREAVCRAPASSAGRNSIQASGKMTTSGWFGRTEQGIDRDASSREKSALDHRSRNVGGLKRNATTWFDGSTMVGVDGQVTVRGSDWAKMPDKQPLTPFGRWTTTVQAAINKSLLHCMDAEERVEERLGTETLWSATGSSRKSHWKKERCTHSHASVVFFVVPFRQTRRKRRYSPACWDFQSRVFFLPFLDFLFFFVVALCLVFLHDDFFVHYDV